MLGHSDAQGHFHAEVIVPKDRDQALEAGLAYKPDGSKSLPIAVYAPGFAPLCTLLGSEKSDVTLALGTTVSGFVRDEAGKPVAGAIVRVRSMYPQRDDADMWLMSSVNVRSLPPDSALLAALQTQTDAQGRWTLHDLFPGGSADITLNDPRFVSPSLSVIPGSTPEDKVVLVAKPVLASRGGRSIPMVRPLLA